jgi:hypothetical protein
MAGALGTAVKSRRWFHVAGARAAALFRSRLAAELALLGTALRTAIRWTLT